MLAKLGHRVELVVGLPHRPYDVLIALHARHGADAIAWSRATYPTRPVILALTGTDLYRDILADVEAKRSLSLADRLVVLHDLGALAVPARFRAKVRVIRQSAEALAVKPRRASRTFDVAFVAHLRAEKDPLRAALAVRNLPPASRIRVLHVGRALDQAHGQEARREAAENPRYQWRGEVAPSAARRLIARARVLVLTSVMEGGANVLGEAIVLGTPPIASRIPAALAALGDDYAGLFRPKSTRALRALLVRAEADPGFLARLERQARRRAGLFYPGAERRAWRALLRELPAAARAARRTRRSSNRVKARAY